VRVHADAVAHWGIDSLEPAALEAARQRLERLQKMGYTAYKSGPGGKWRGHEPPAVIDAFVKRAYLMREWVGNDVELAFDFHGKFNPAFAIELCHELKGMRPVFVEEPVPQENVDALKQVTDHVPFPIATGERFLSRWEFRQVFEKQAAAFIQPDGSHAGGITELKKIANMAEVYYMQVLPHCAIGPVAFSACMQVDAAVPNFLMQEQVDACLGNGLLETDWVVQDGHVALPTRPGLGFEINEREAQQNIAYKEELGGEFYHPADNSIVDW
jgi:galactonate dehydratase